MPLRKKTIILCISDVLYEVKLQYYSTKIIFTHIFVSKWPNGVVLSESAVADSRETGCNV